MTPSFKYPGCYSNHQFFGGNGMCKNVIRLESYWPPASSAFTIIPVVLIIFLLLCVVFSASEIAIAQEGGSVREDLFSVSFPNEQQGWACGRWGTVLHTGDGGQRWVKQDSSTDYTLSSISFPDPKNGWAVGEGGTIIHTKDGGQNWVNQKCPVGYFLMGVSFTDENKGWAVTEWTNILHTEDGGENWRVQFKDDDFVLKSVSFCDAFNGWVAGEYGFIYHTADGGQTWEHQAGSFAMSEDSFELVGGNTLFNVLAIDPVRALVVGIDGYLARTVDGGKTWEKIGEGIPKTQLFGVCTDRQANTIIIGGKRNLLVGSDGNTHFKTPEIDPPVTYGWIYGITPRGSKGFVAVGKEGCIYLADSKGETWHRATIPDSTK